jgi:hypothetical protein
MIDSISQLAMAVYTALQPYWPVFAQKASEELTEAAPEAFNKLFGLVQGHSEKHEAASGAISGLLANPEDAQQQTVFQTQLKDLLERDPEFASRIRAALSELPDPSTQTITQSGSGNVATQHNSSNISNDQSGGYTAHTVNIHEAGHIGDPGINAADRDTLKQFMEMLKTSDRKVMEIPVEHEWYPWALRMINLRILRQEHGFNFSLYH